MATRCLCRKSATTEYGFAKKTWEWSCKITDKSLPLSQSFCSRGSSRASGSALPECGTGQCTKFPKSLKRFLTTVLGSSRRESGSYFGTLFLGQQIIALHVVQILGKRPLRVEGQQVARSHKIFDRVVQQG